MGGPATERVSIGTKYHGPAVGVPAVVGLFTGGIAATYWHFNGMSELFLLWGAVAGVCWRVSALELWRAYRGRRWLWPTADGFDLAGRHGTAAHRDDDVLDLVAWRTTEFASGRPAVQRVAGSLTLAGVRVVPFEYEYRAGELDPLAAFLGRLTARLVARAEVDVKAGGRLVGDGWTFGPNGLTVEAAGGPVVLPAEDIADVRALDGAVGVWRRGDDSPAVRLPLDSANVGVLAELLARDRPAVEEPVFAPGLGRELLRRDNSVTGVLGPACGLGCFLTAVGVGVAGAASAGFPVVAASFGLVGLLGAVVAGVAAWRRRVDVTRCHERGVVHDRPGGTVTLRYDACDGFAFDATDHHEFGGYKGTSYTLRFWPAAGPLLQVGWFSKEPDPTAEAIRDRVSRTLAVGMLDRLAGGGEVPWVDGVTLCSDGLAVGRGAVVPYADLGRVQVEAGECRVIGPYGRLLARVRLTDRNAFPGLMALRRLVIGG